MNIAGIRSPIDPINNILKASPGIEKSPESKPETQSFAQMVSQRLEETNSLQKEADRLTVDFIQGRPVEIHEMLIAAEKADLALRETVAIRDRLIEAYKQIANMQI